MESPHGGRTRRDEQQGIVLLEHGCYNPQSKFRLYCSLAQAKASVGHFLAHVSRCFQFAMLHRLSLPLAALSLRCAEQGAFLAEPSTYVDPKVSRLIRPANKHSSVCSFEGFSIRFYVLVRSMVSSLFGLWFQYAVHCGCRL